MSPFREIYLATVETGLAPSYASRNDRQSLPSNIAETAEALDLVQLRYCVVI
jgi:hypothetical protein